MVLAQNQSCRQVEYVSILINPHFCSHQPSTKVPRHVSEWPLLVTLKPNTKIDARLFPKLNPRWIRDLDARPETFKLQEHTKIGTGSDFSNRMKESKMD